MPGITRHGRWIGLLLLGLLLAARVGAAAVVLDVGTPEGGGAEVSLSRHWAVLEDPGQMLSLADVRAPHMAARFESNHLPAPALSFGFTRSAYWLRLVLRNTSDHSVERMLELGYPLLSHIQLHRPGAGGADESLSTGAAMPFATRPRSSRTFVFPLTLPARSEQTLYLRLQSTSAMLVPAVLWEPGAFAAKERNEYATQAWYFGMASALILFNLLLFAALREGVYLSYAVFALCTALTISASNGLGKEFLWPATTWWSDIAISVLGALTFVALLVFMRRILGTRESMPRLDWLIRVFIGLQLLFPLAVAWSPQGFAVPGTRLVGATGLLVLFVGLYGAIVLRQRIALIFVSAFSLWIAGVVLVGAKTLTLLPANTLTMNGYQIGSALEMLLLAFALAYRFNMIRQRANEDVRQANASLAERLREREVELTASHQRLREIEHRQTLAQERQRLMQDMHDGVGSSLASALRVVERGRLDGKDVADVLRSCIDDLKLAIDSMEPVDSDLLLLLATLRYRLGPRLDSIGIALRWDVRDVPPLDWLDPRSSLHVLRIAQEALTNTIRHANATEVRVATSADERGVTVTIDDNGTGFDVERALGCGGKGLPNQRRRAEAIGAEVDWRSTPGGGTRLSLRLPFARRETNPALDAESAASAAQ